jgi:hypothetical protein
LRWRAAEGALLDHAARRPVGGMGKGNTKEDEGAKRSQRIPGIHRTHP